MNCCVETYKSVDCTIFEHTIILDNQIIVDALLVHPGMTVKTKSSFGIIINTQSQNNEIVYSVLWSDQREKVTNLTNLYKKIYMQKYCNISSKKMI